jgi:ankyrin repeat protein
MAYLLLNPTRTGLYLLAVGMLACNRTLRSFEMERSLDNSASISAPNSPPRAAWEDSIIAIGRALQESANKKTLKPETEMHHAAWLSDRDLLQEKYRDHGLYLHYVLGTEKVTLLHLAVYRGMDNCIQLLLDRGALVSLGMKSSGIQPIHIAASQGNASVLIRLLEAGASVEAIDAMGRTALHWAAAKGSTICIHELLRKGSFLLRKSDMYNDTPLCLALRYGHVFAVKQLIQEGGVVDCLYCMNGSSDHIARWALVHGHDSCLEALVKREHIVLECQKEDAHGTTLWQLALRKKQRIGFQWLLKHTADLDYQDAQGNTLFHLALQEGFTEKENFNMLIDKLKTRINTPNHDGETPLHRAVAYKNTEAIRALLTAEADVNAQNKDGDIPLHIAVACRRIKTIDLLLNTGVTDLDVQNQDGDIPLHTAVAHRHATIINLLLNAGSKVNAKNHQGQTPLHKAAIVYNNFEAIQALLDAGADANAKNQYGVTPLHKAATVYNNFEAIQELLGAGADANAKNQYGVTPLHKAVLFGHAETVRSLLAAGAEVNTKDKYGDTPLHIAAKNGQTEMIIALLTAKADRNIKNNNRDTPLKIAQKEKHSEAVKLLEMSGLG